MYLLREGFEVFGVDVDPRAIDEVRKKVPLASTDNFRVETVEAMSFADAFADVVLSSAVLHFARDDEHFEKMLQEMWRVLKPGGMLFCRLASSIGIETQVKRVAGRRHVLPDGSERYLVDEEILLKWTEVLGARMLDPLKTTVVQQQRAMTTWVIAKNRKISSRR